MDQTEFNQKAVQGLALLHRVMEAIIGHLPTFGAKMTVQQASDHIAGLHAELADAVKADTSANDLNAQEAESHAEGDGDSDTIEIPPGHDAELDALRAQAAVNGISYSNRMRASGLRKLLGLGPDDYVEIKPEQLPEEKRDQVLQEADDNVADQLNAEEAAKQDHSRT